MRVSAILLAAGRGTRFGAGQDKLLDCVGAKPVIIYSLAALSAHPLIEEIVVVANRLNRNCIIEKLMQCRIPKVHAVVLGGRKRQDSAHNGLRAASGQADMVLFHDGARPFITRTMISSVIKSGVKTGAAIVAVPVKATIKAVRGAVVKNTLKRNELWEVQTPQVFRVALLKEAYKRCKGREVTDDASLVERLGVKVAVVQGSYFNIKITTPEDMVMAQAIAKQFKYR
ncbi:MAG: 2-C-methyl-D-erythritol 4-phosphate cytidylyltransferase [Candidatus Omnitrophica bacterium]|nr:2-C-methyl-D-erythritol 4-phosphate cytidylyltransferase [Candidatus Omnitrophota bacterium]